MYYYMMVYSPNIKCNLSDIFYLVGSLPGKDSSSPAREADPPQKYTLSGHYCSDLDRNVARFVGFYQTRSAALQLLLVLSPFR